MPSSNRELLALLALIFLMPFVGGFLFLALASVLVLIFGGMEDLVRLSKDLSWIPPYGHQTSFKILVGLALAAAMILAIVIWKNVFWRQNLNRASSHNAPVIRTAKDGWSALAYFSFSLLSSYLAYDAFSRSGTLISLLFSCIALWALAWGIIKAFKNK